MGFLNLIERKENPLFPRDEVVAVITGISSTPSRELVLKELSDKLGASPDTIAITKIEHHFGTKEAIIFARVYPNADALKKFEKSFVSVRGKLKEKKG